MPCHLFKNLNGSLHHASSTKESNQHVKSHLVRHAVPLHHLSKELLDVVPPLSSAQALQEGGVADRVRLESVRGQPVQELPSVINTAFPAHAIDDDIVGDNVGHASLDTHLVQDRHGLPKPAVLAQGLEEHGVGDDAGLAPAPEHIVEQAERVGDPAAVAKAADQGRVRVRVGRDGHGRDEPARGVEVAVAAVPRDEGVVGEDVDGRARRLGGAEHARGVGGAAPAAEVADELGAEVHVGGLPVAGGGALDEARGPGEVLARDEAAEVGAGGVGRRGRVG